tara:strand:- start:75 stop:224 length:150 start_codon:yes stop_codon:yes gene_type:complete
MHPLRSQERYEVLDEVVTGTGADGAGQGGEEEPHELCRGPALPERGRQK